VPYRRLRDLESHWLAADELTQRLGLDEDLRQSLKESYERSHIEHIYTKIGASNRARASLFAMKHALMSDS
jgi:hypothetical protein